MGTSRKIPVWDILDPRRTVAALVVSCCTARPATINSAAAAHAASRYNTGSERRTRATEIR